MNINSAKILYNFIKYSKDFNYDFAFRKFEPNVKFIDISYCEFDHILNDFDFRKFVRNNLHNNNNNHLYDLETLDENKILSVDYLLENNISTGNFKIYKYFKKRKFEGF